MNDDEKNKFSNYASRIFSSRLLEANSKNSSSTPIFQANYDRSDSKGPWMNDEEIEQEMAHLQQSLKPSTSSNTNSAIYQSPLPSPSPPSSSTPDLNQAQSLFTNQSKLSHHAPTPPPNPPVIDNDDNHEEIELQLSQPLIPHDNNHNENNESDEDHDDIEPNKIFIQHQTSIPTVPTQNAIPIRKYRDAPFIAAFGFSSITVIIIGLITIFSSKNDTITPPNSSPFITNTLLHATPLLVCLTFVASVLGGCHIIVLRYAVIPIMYAVLGLILFGLLGSSTWAFAGSFVDDDDDQDSNFNWASWWQSSGLRLFSLIPFLAIIWFGRTVYIRRNKIRRSVTMVELSSQIILSHPTIIIYHMTLTLLSTLLSIPFAGLIYKLLRIGHWDSPPSQDEIARWHVHTSSDILSIFVLIVGFWTWSVLRGIAIVMTSGVIGAWYFNRHDPINKPDPQILVQSSFYRSTHASFGSVCLGSSVVTVVTIILRILTKVKNVSTPKSNILYKFSPLAFVLSTISTISAMIIGYLEHISSYALIHVGITGDAFTPSAKRVRNLINRREVSGLMDQLLVKSTIRLFAFMIASFSAIASFVYTSHHLNVSIHAPVISIVGGWLTYSAIRMWGDIISTSVDSIYVCYCFDVATGQQHCIKASEAFGNPQLMREAV